MPIRFKGVETLKQVRAHCVGRAVQDAFNVIQCRPQIASRPWGGGLGSSALQHGDRHMRKRATENTEIMTHVVLHYRERPLRCN